MRVSGLLSASIFLLLAAPAAPAQNADVPPGDKTPLLRLEAGGPTSLVTVLAFQPDGQRLYAAGLDKIVRVWERNADSGGWEEKPAYRIPLGPGGSGMINALALSPDGNWLAVGGVGLFRSRSGFRDQGVVVPSQVMDPVMRQDLGAVYVFNVKTRAVRVLRGHEGVIWSLAFAPPQQGQEGPPPLVSAARHWVDRTNTFTGALWVWDLDRRTYRDWSDALPDPDTMKVKRPGLAVWRLPGRPKRLQVAFAWGDGKFRHWDVERGQDGMSQQGDAPDNNTVAYLAGRDRVLTGGLRSPSGYLQPWSLPAGQEPRQQTLLPDNLSKKAKYLPRALAAYSARDGGPVDHAAVVLSVLLGDGEHTRLHLLDLDPQARDPLQASVKLWWPDEVLPTLSVAANGRFLAVAGKEGHEVWVYAIADLVADQEKAQPVKLASTGATARYVSFAKKGRGLGLVLNARPKEVRGSPPRNLEEGDRIFDFSKPGLDETDGWSVDAPSLDGWDPVRVTAERKGKQFQFDITIRKGGDLVRRIRPEPDHLVTDCALLPPRPPLNRALLAVALKRDGDTSLRLYDVRTGKVIRHYTGHDAAIRSVAFSADGRLLASAADDQTVCVWTLTDLKQTLGQRGLIEGLAVKSLDNQVVVASVAPGSAAARELQADDVIVALVTPQGPKQALTSARQFYQAVWEKPPGGRLQFQVKNRGMVSLRVGQGIDERKPLLTLFLTRQGEHWLGWDSFGRYEASSARAERHLGWHFNTGQAARPVAFFSFDRADQYRRKYHSPGLLKQLVQKANPADVVINNQAGPERRPRITLLVGEVVLDPAKADARGRIPVQTRQPTLRVAIHELPRDQIAMVQWQLNDGAPHKFGQAAGLEWSADLPPNQWKRGVYQVRVTVKTASGREYSEVRQVRYQPPRPDVTTDLPARQVVMKGKFPVTGLVRPARRGEKVKVQILLNGRPVKAFPAQAADRTIDESLDLRPDENVIEIVAVNQDALADHEDVETNSLVLEVVFKPVKPQVVFERVLPLGGDAAQLAIEVTPNKPVVVTVPRLRLRGSITATEKLLEAKRDDASLNGFQPGRKMTFTINEVFRLKKPGPQDITFLVKTRNTEIRKVLRVDYRPLLPQIEFRPQRDDLVFYDEGRGPPEVEMLFQLTPRAPAPEGKQFRREVQVNGRPLPADQLTFDPDTMKLTVKFTPQVTRSQVRVRLTGQWSDPVSSGLLDVEYRRPPYHLAFVQPPRRSEDPVITLTATVRSPPPLTPDDVVAQVNGRPIANPEVAAQGDGTWRIRLKDVSLRDVKNSESLITLNVSNADGACRKPIEHKVVFVGKPPKRPEVVILAPGNTSVTEPRVVIQLRIRSETPLRRLTLVNANGPAGQPLDVSSLPQGAQELKLALRLVPRELRRPLDLATLNRDADGYLAADLGRPLVRGLNRLSVVAANEGGDSEPARVIINYVPPPVRLVLDRLVPVDDEGTTIPIDLSPAGKFLKEVPRAHLVLHGRVIWDQGQDDRLRGVEWVRARVNGLQQAPAVRLENLDRAEDRVRSFQIKLLLTRAKDNRLEIDLPGLEQEDSSRGTYLIDCAQPLKDKRFLHLLIVGIGEKDATKLRDRVLAALGAKPAGRGRFALATFEDVHLYGPLAGTVDPDAVYFQLFRMKKTIDALAREGPSSHVVLVYYHGGEAVSKQGHWLRTSNRKVDPKLATYRIPCDELEKSLAGTLGAKILLLDVQRDGANSEPRDRDRVANWPASSYVAVMRYAELGQPDPTDAGHLIRAWQEALARASKLKEVEDHVQVVARKLKPLFQKRGMALLYDWYIPQGLLDLVIGGKT